MTPRKWTAERISSLIDLVKTGITLREAGRRLGLTKNQVVGALYRSREWQQYCDSRNPDVVRSTHLSAQFETLKSAGCRWINGDPRQPDWTYCNAPVCEVGSAWCADHRKIVYQGSDKTDLASSLAAVVVG